MEIQRHLSSDETIAAMKAYLQEHNVKFVGTIDDFLDTPDYRYNGFSVVGLVHQGHGDAIWDLLRSMVEQGAHDYDQPLNERWPTLEDIAREENLVLRHREKTHEEIAALIRGAAKAWRFHQDLAVVIVDDAYIGRWIHAPNPAFGGLTPWEMIKAGRGEEIRRMLFALESGMPI